MFDIRMNPNSIYVPMIRTGCCIGEFDSTYPVHLNGILSQDEYRESIEKVNHITASNTAMKVLVILFILITITGIILFDIGRATVTDSDPYTDDFPPLEYAGLDLDFGGPLIFNIGFFVVNLQRIGKIQNAVTEESRKHSSRSSTPCRWRLEVSNYCRRRYGDNSQFDCCIVIKTSGSPVRRRGGRPSNQHVNESSYLVGQKNNDVPPPYSSLPAEFCSQCGATRSDLSVRFCAFCGQPFNIY